MYQLFKWLSVIGMSLLCTTVFAKQALIYLNVAEPKDQYQVDLIQFLFKDSTKYDLQVAAHKMLESRQEAELQNGGLSVAAFAAGKDIEQRLQPVRIPILKGLLGHRIFIIRDGEQDKFSKVNDFASLQDLKAGQGKLWTDTQVLRSAGIPTVVTNKYPNLFYMLEGGRFDYFPRAVHEPFSEVASRQDLNLVVEPDLMLVYPLPLYLFVGKNNTELATDIRVQLERTIADGSFDDFFFSHPLVRDVLKKAHVKDRRVFKIDNPHLSAETPLQRPELWLDINKIKV
ncbi:diguanylate cyclase [Saccharobesus litoralis]|uniref:Diguanylate cyclase n=1 Tax=Saccharobesus litoralis TaxID=2172099 RepID=A0A2S0VMY3_9ALTE|nr:diguanylate cyclase [Saccharobesus litoralis]AWB65565.1 diguanylate cyclase [Saccharobesus litoralis]